MTITLNTLVYNQDASVTKDKVDYTGPSNTFAVKDKVSLARVAPKPTATFDGVARAEVKRTKTVTLANGQKADAIVTAAVSFPVGMTKVDADALRDDVGDFLIGTDGDALFWSHDITR